MMQVHAYVLIRVSLLCCLCPECFFFPPVAVGFRRKQDNNKYISAAEGERK